MNSEFQELCARARARIERDDDCFSDGADIVLYFLKNEFEAQDDVVSFSIKKACAVSGAPEDASPHAFWLELEMSRGGFAAWNLPLLFEKMTMNGWTSDFEVDGFCATVFFDKKIV